MEDGIEWSVRQDVRQRSMKCGRKRKTRKDSKTWLIDSQSSCQAAAEKLDLDVFFDAQNLLPIYATYQEICIDAHRAVHRLNRRA
jgi:hypothetical protein